MTTTLGKILSSCRSFFVYAFVLADKRHQLCHAGKYFVLARYDPVTRTYSLYDNSVTGVTDSQLDAAVEWAQTAIKRLVNTGADDLRDRRCYGDGAFKFLRKKVTEFSIKRTHRFPEWDVRDTLVDMEVAVSIKWNVRALRECLEHVRYALFFPISKRRRN